MDKRWRNIIIILAVVIVAFLVYMTPGLFLVETTEESNIENTFLLAGTSINDFNDSIGSFAISLEDNVLLDLEVELTKISNENSVDGKYAKNLLVLIEFEKRQNTLVSEITNPIDTMTFAEYCPSMEIWEDMALDAVDLVAEMIEEKELLDMFYLENESVLSVAVSYDLNALDVETDNIVFNVDRTTDACLAATYSDEIDYSDLNLGSIDYEYYDEIMEGAE